MPSSCPCGDGLHHRLALWQWVRLRLALRGDGLRRRICPRLVLVATDCIIVSPCGSGYAFVLPFVATDCVDGYAFVLSLWRRTASSSRPVAVGTPSSCPSWQRTASTDMPSFCPC